MAKLQPGHFLDQHRVSGRTRQLFLDEQQVPSVANPREAEAIVQIVLKILSRGKLDPADIGIMTLYRSQQLLLKQAFQIAEIVSLYLVEISLAVWVQERLRSC